ncbi:hypothetical protein PMAYCL1PPCAC_09368 [Pristionchus mayeri]|uniref:Uncharacterized protein n=1 Tax=Pristionchus mayeri TaxID=1317129 RepID=A0AAN4ZDH8_9BILA|nr:hypothetical protein PMAYCL1PPCAC_09368 [Pristionchus mayeri]
MERNLVESAREIDVLKRQNDGETSELRKAHADLVRDHNQLKTSNAEEIAELNRKIEEMQEEISEMAHERDALDNADRANAELNMRRLREKINKLTLENKSLIGKFNDEKNQLNTIIDLQKRNLENEIRITDEMSERHKLKEEANAKEILKLRNRVYELAQNRTRKDSEAVVDEEDDTTNNINSFLAGIKQHDHSEKNCDPALAETHFSPSQASKSISELSSVSTPKPSKSSTEDVAPSPIPNDPTSPPPSPPPPPPPPSTFSTMSTDYSPLKFTSRVLDFEFCSSNDATGSRFSPSKDATASSRSSPVTSPADARSNLMSELQSALKFRERALEQARAGNFEVASIVRKSIRGRSRSMHRDPNSDD